MPRNLTLAIMIGMLLGVIVGFICNQTLVEAGDAERLAGYFSIVSEIFLKMIKMIIAPLVFATLVAGVAHMGDGRAIGRIGAKTLGWFMGASLISLTLGMILVNLLQPGRGLNLPLPIETESGVAAKTPDLASFLVDIVPASVVEAMASNAILQIVVFALFFGTGLAAIGETGRPLVRAIEALTEVMLKVTGYVMMVAPLAVFAAIAAVITTEGLGVLVVFGRFIGQFYLGLALLWTLLILAGFLVLGRAVLPLLRAIRGPLMLAFSTASSEAAYPRTLERLVGHARSCSGNPRRSPSPTGLALGARRQGVFRPPQRDHPLSASAHAPRPRPHGNDPPPRWLRHEPELRGGRRGPPYSRSRPGRTRPSASSGRISKPRSHRGGRRSSTGSRSRGTARAFGRRDRSATSFSGACRRCRSGC
ncbi:Aerobic C4-dicarboxylate transport protein [compost metagenome]